MFVSVGDIRVALQLPDVKFKQKYGFSKPPEDGQGVIFYCHAGVRSLEAALIARNLGFKWWAEIVIFLFDDIHNIVHDKEI